MGYFGLWLFITCVSVVIAGFAVHSFISAKSKPTDNQYWDSIGNGCALIFFLVAGGAWTCWEFISMSEAYGKTREVLESQYPVLQYTECGLLMDSRALDIYDEKRGIKEEGNIISYYSLGGKEKHLCYSNYKSLRSPK